MRIANRSWISRLLGRMRSSLVNGLGMAAVPLRDREIIKQSQKYSMASARRLHANIEAVDYVISNGIDGSIVECGVWKGGGTMSMMLKLMDLGEERRDFFLFDTFSGMAGLSGFDEKNGMGNAETRRKFNRQQQGSKNDWCCAPLQEVKKNVQSIKYPADRIHYVVGDVRDTLPQTGVGEIAILRLDTDWYESTKQELETLFPKLARGGVLIVDDYGAWKGAQKAVDEYFQSQSRSIFLQYVDASGRMGIRQ